MNETPEASPPAFPSAEPAAAPGPAEVVAGRSPRANGGGPPKRADEWPAPPADELPALPDEPPATVADAWQAPIAGALGRAVRGTWRVAVAEESMAPALAPGDWLLLDPTSGRWPRRGSIVVFREPDCGIMAIKRVAAGPGDRVRISAGVLHLRPDEAWLLGDNSAVSVDSRRYGPVPVDALVGRAWFRYGPLKRVGPIGRSGTPVDGPSSAPGSRDELRDTDGGGAMWNRRP